MNKKIDVSDRYSYELSEIEYIISGLEQRRVYELSGAKMDGFLATNAKKLGDKIKDLVRKIEYDLPSIDDSLGVELNGKVRKENGKDG